ncbi:armadillo-type protein [Umbelopsis sp. PMI_123]|nr:armadillo-type protein [Umbelopsis sp. PMI_123]
MEQLLQWAINNTDQEQLRKDAEAIKKGEKKPDPSKFDPKVIEAILGKDDATRMKEAVDCISDEKDTVENKVIALDNLEMLIEGIDNAMNLENMNLWPAIVAQLNNDNEEIRKGVAWVCGTAVQNNPKAQKALLDNNGLEPLLNLLRNTAEDKEVRAKAQYALSGLIKHFPEGLAQFKEKGGFEALAEIVKNPQDSTILRKTIFLYNTLMLEDPSLSKLLASQEIPEAFAKVLTKSIDEEDEDLAEKTLRSAYTLVDQTNLFVPPKLASETIRAGDKFGVDNLGLSNEEWTTLTK